MREPILFDDEYTGPRWTYGLTFRPLMIATTPKGWIVGSLRDSEEFRHGMVDFPFELSEDQCQSYELELCAVIKETIFVDEWAR